MATDSDIKKSNDLMLKRKAKKRYVSIMHGGRDIDSVDALTRRCSDLFGTIATEKAGLRLICSDENVIVIRCRLVKLNEVLVAIALTDFPLLTLDISASLRRLKRRL